MGDVRIPGKGQPRLLCPRRCELDSAEFRMNLTSAIDHKRRVFAIVPAAGLSRRMGQDKLLMQRDGQTVLREALLVADHNAYHLGQLVLLRRCLGSWHD